MMLATGTRWFLWSEDVVPEVVDLPFFSDFIDGRRQILVQDNTGTSFGRRATATCASLRAAGLFIDSQSLAGDSAFSDLTMVEARCIFRCSSRRRPLATVVAGNSRDRFVFLDLLGFYLQIQDNHLSRSVF